MKLPSLSRRQLLAATGVAGATLFLPSMFTRSGRARAQSAPIKRIVFLIQDHGTVRSYWRMPRANKDYGNWEYNFDDSDPLSFSEILRPLHPRRKDLLVLEGLAQASTSGDRATNNHNAGHLHLLTGAKMVDDNNAGGPSIDQIIAQHVAVPGRIDSLAYSTEDPWLGGYSNIAASQRTPVEIDPRSAFQRLFPAGFDDMQMVTERDKIRAARSSVLDLVQNEYAQISPKLGTDDKAKLDMHRQLIRDLEMRVNALANFKCSAPATPAFSNKIDRPGRTKMYADMVASAFACDLTRVATITVNQLDNADFGAPPGDVHQDFAHQTDRDQNAAKYMADYNRVHAELFSYLIESLAKYADGEGTLLDNTACVWITELATGPHALEAIPIVMAGSCGGEFRTGRYLSWAQSNPDPGAYANSDSPRQGPGHTRLLISLLNAMGVDQDKLGMESTVTRFKPITTIPLTGALDRLT